MAPAPVVQQPEHRKARRTAEVIGADRVLPATAAPSSIEGEVRANSSMEPPASPVIGLGAILALAGRANHLNSN
jgi:hypothetical protein